MRLATYSLIVILNSSLAIASGEGKEEEYVMETPPHFFSIGSTTNTGVLSMQCEGDKPYKVISCYFNQIDIRGPNKQQGDDTCVMRQYQYSETMDRITNNRWTSRLYAGGIRTIEHDPKNHVLWKYTEITNDTPSKIIIYTWDSPTKYALDCKNVFFPGVNKSSLNIQQSQ